MGKKDALALLKQFKKKYPQAKIALNYGSSWELLVATMLSAQCTDIRVNIVTRDLFTKYRMLQEYATVKQAELEQDIRSTGFFRNKAKNIIASAQIILNQFNGQIPQTMEQLVQLPGVARKTANIVLFNAFGKNDGIAVDTHVKRLSQRLGLSEQKDPNKIEQDLMRLFPQKEWGALSYYLIEHGRALCQARKPKCLDCFLKDQCPEYQSLNLGIRG